MTKTAKIISSAALILMLIAGIVLAGITQGFQNWNFGAETIEEQSELNENSGGSLIVSEITSSSNIKLASSDATATAASTSGVTLTATITPSTATDKTVDWSVEFVNASSSWASGKTASDYLSVTPTSDGSTTATVSAISAFGEQIKITVTCRTNTDITASCTVDYGERLGDISTLTFLNTKFATSQTLTNSGVQSVEAAKGANWQGMYAMYAGSGTFTYEPAYNSNYTVANEDSTVSVSVKPTSEFYSALQAQGIAKSTNSYVTLESLTAKAIYESMCSVTIIPINGTDSSVYTNLNLYNTAITNASGTYDFDIKISVTTDYETKDYVIQCQFNRSGTAFTATSVALSPSSIVL